MPVVIEFRPDRRLADRSEQSKRDDWVRNAGEVVAVLNRLKSALAALHESTAHFDAMIETYAGVAADFQEISKSWRSSDLQDACVLTEQVSDRLGESLQLAVRMRRDIHQASGFVSRAAEELADYITRQRPAIK